MTDQGARTPPHVLMTQCACVGSWATAVLRGTAAPDQALDAMRALGFTVTVTSGSADPTPPPGGASSFALAIGSWRSRGVTGWRYVPMAPGDSSGAPGPGRLRARASDAGALLVSVQGPPLALIPEPVTGSGDATAILRLEETEADDHGAPAPDSLTDLDRELLAALTDVTEQLDALEVASWRDEVHSSLSGWDEVPDLPPGAPTRAQRLAARSGRVLALVDLAGDDHGGSRTASEMSQRSEYLRSLARVARAAHAAAWNAAGGATDPRR